MPRDWRLAILVAIVFEITPRMSLAHLPAPSRWRLDDARSAFDGGPVLRSDIFTIHQDIPTRLSIDFATVDDHGQSTRATWRGPEDGRFRRLLGAPNSWFSLNAQGEERWRFPGGVSYLCRLELAKDHKTLTVSTTISIHGVPRFHQRLVYLRVR